MQLAALLLLSPAVVQTGYHLSARPWKPLAIARDRYLEAIEGVCRFSIRHQDASGAIIDPFLNREHQYATPYFANAVGTLIAAGRARDLLPNGVRAMEHATANFAGGQKSIPDEHGNFFIAALTEALELYAGLVSESTLKTWRERMRRPRRDVVSDGTNNWETYTMKGEWMRLLAGLADRNDAVAAIEEAWQSRQRARIAPAPWRLYHDRTSKPDTLSVEAVGRGNLLALAELGYDGPSGAEIREIAEAGTAFTLLLQDPSGQVPANGRTDDHVWVDIGYQLAFEVMAEREQRKGHAWLAGQFRRAAMLAFQSAQRWRRSDGPWTGSYFVTKNHFDPRLRVGHQQASQYSNYNGSLMFHLSEAWRARRTKIEERPTPSEIGGYAIALDEQFASVFANAGGMQVQANLRGQTSETHGNWWTPMGIVRFARPGWETRLGPSDGALAAAGGVTFAPEFLENGGWVRIADLSARYEGVWSAQFVHPLLVRCSISYRPLNGGGPTFRNDLSITPDGVLSEVRKTSPGETAWGVTLPLLVNDGSPLAPYVTKRVVSTGYPGDGDRQNFLLLSNGSETAAGAPMRSSYGDLQPVRVTVAGDMNRTFVYPSSPGDPPAEDVQGSFAITKDGYRSVLGRVAGDLYIGRTAAGGFGQQIDLDGDGAPEAKFSARCGFILQTAAGKVAAVETDREVEAEIERRSVSLRPYTPVTLTASARERRPARGPAGKR